ncbi:MAG: response regulator [Kiritimatiellae bacterium]|jgi:PAS domain S-box-containing protein|nr:response regulator [Kiritimatiellia bacterium]
MEIFVIRPLLSIRGVSCIALALSLFLPGVLSAKPATHIFILHSYSQDYPWTKGQHDGFMQTLTEDTQLNATFSIEYLDTKQHAYDQDYANEMARHLQMKYKGCNLAAIYVTDDNALLFARAHLCHIFPGTAVFYSGVNDNNLLKALDPSLFTGVVENKEVGPNLEWLLSIDKDANDLIFVGDNSAIYQMIEKHIRKDLAPFQLRAEFIAEKRLDIALKKIHGLPGKYLFLTTLGSMTDENGRTLPLRYILRSLALKGHVVISMEDAYINEGVLGGYVASSLKQGMYAARLFLEYHHGKPIAEIQPILESPNLFIFDDQVLQQQGIILSRKHRAQAILLNPRLAFYDKHRILIMSSLTALVLLLCIVTGSLLILSKKNRALALARNRSESAMVLYNQLAEQSRTVSWEINKEGLFTYVSPVSYTVLGYQPEELITTKHFFDLLPKENIDNDKITAFDFIATKGSFHDLESTVITKDGQKIVLLINGIPVIDDNGMFQGYRGSGNDISRRKKSENKQMKLQAQLTQARKMESIGRLAGGVAHDFNNMLSVIIGHTEMVIEQLDPALLIHTDMQEIKKAAERSADLTRQLLAFARKQTVKPRVLDLNQTMEGMLQMLRRLIGEDIDLAWKPGEELGLVHIDPSQIDQILANLCVNARDAITDVGKITIETGTTLFDKEYCSKNQGIIPGKFILLAVSDDGCGMDKQTLAHVFEPFFTTKESGKGTGLGLATIYGIVKQNNGFVNVYSEPDQGTTFKIYLPIYIGQSGQTKEQDLPKPEVRGHEMILLVEDEPAILRMTTMILEKLGYTVLAAGTPSEAIRLASEHADQLNLLMTDVVMPEMTGQDLAKKLQSTYPNLTVLFMSGYTANVIAHQGVLEEGIHFIQKPFTKQDLANKVHGAITGKS